MLKRKIDKYLEEIIIYQTDDDQTQIDVRLENEKVWLTQAQMAELFQTDRTSIVRHINKIYADDELDRDSTCAKIAQVQKEEWQMSIASITKCKLNKKHKNICITQNKSLPLQRNTCSPFANCVKCDIIN